MAGFTYATLTTAIQNYCEVDTTVFTSTITDQFIMNAEFRINNDLPMDSDRFVSEGTMAADVNNVRVPAGTLFVRGVEVFNASNSTEMGTWLERRDQTFLSEYVGRLTGPEGSTTSGADVTGKPKYYAMFGGATGTTDTTSGSIYLAPTPDVNYIYRIAGRPGDDTTVGSGRITIHYQRGIYATSQFDTTQAYPLNVTLYVGLDGKLTSSQPTDSHPGVAICTGPPSAAAGTLEFMLL